MDFGKSLMNELNIDVDVNCALLINRDPIGDERYRIRKEYPLVIQTMDDIRRLISRASAWKSIFI